MKHKKLYHSITLISLKVLMIAAVMNISSCNSDLEFLEEPKSEIYLTDFLKSSIMLSLELRFYEYDELENAVTFDYGGFAGALNAELGMELIDTKAVSSIILSQNDSPHQKTTLSNVTVPDEFSEYQKEIKETSSFYDLGNQEILFEALQSLGEEIFSSTILSNEHKVILFRQIEFS